MVFIHFHKRKYDVSSEKFGPLSDVHSKYFLHISVGLFNEQMDVGDQSDSKTAPSLLRDDIDLLTKSGQLQRLAIAIHKAVLEPRINFEGRI